MDVREVWSNLHRTFQMSPRELYDNEEMEQLQRQSINTIMSMSESEIRVSLSHHIRDVMLSDQAIANGDGWRDVLAFLDWVDGGMD